MAAPRVHTKTIAALDIQRKSFSTFCSLCHPRALVESRNHYDSSPRTIKHGCRFAPLVARCDAVSQRVVEVAPLARRPTDDTANKSTTRDLTHECIYHSIYHVMNKNAKRKPSRKALIKVASDELYSTRDRLESTEVTDDGARAALTLRVNELETAIASLLLGGL